MHVSGLSLSVLFGALHRAFFGVRCALFFSSSSKEEEEKEEGDSLTRGESDRHRSQSVSPSVGSTHHCTRDRVYRRAKPACVCICVFRLVELGSSCYLFVS